MTDSPPLELTHEALDAFRDALRDAGAPIADQFEPGLTDEQIDALGRELGVDVPPELRTLWSWGVAPAKSGVDNTNWTVNHEYDLWPPTHAMSATHDYRGVVTARRNAVALAGTTNKTWLLIASGPQSASPVTEAFNDDPDTLIVAPSLGALFGLWTKVLADGSYRFTDGWWEPEEGPPVIFLPSAS